MKVIRSIKLMMAVVFFFTSIHAFAQIVSYDHDPSVMNQFTVGEAGIGALMPSVYYDTFHPVYRTTAYATAKQIFRTHLQLALFKQESYAENMDSTLNDRKRVELKNIADRTPGIGDVAWQFERGKVEGKRDILKSYIEKITIEGGSIQSYRLWLERYNAIQCGIDAVRDAYMPQGNRKEQYLAIYKDILRLTLEVCEYLNYLRSVKLMKRHAPDSGATIAPVDTTQIRRIALASHGRWKIALAAVSGGSVTP